MVEESAKYIPFRYGWCRTDHKSGFGIREEWPRKDYFKDEPYASRLKMMLGKLGLPIPKPKEIFRGTRHDLLFLNNHGVVLRIGPLDIEDLVHPGVLQPLGWLEDKKSKISLKGKNFPFVVGVYPGIELYQHYMGEVDTPPLADKLQDLFNSTGQWVADRYLSENYGIIRVPDEKEGEVAVKVLLDLDNGFIESSCEVKSLRAVFPKSADKSSFSCVDRADRMLNMMTDIFSHLSVDMRYREKAFMLHHPLRKLFWQAFGQSEADSVKPDVAARESFWRTCAKVTNNPEKNITVPHWRMTRGPDSSFQFHRTETKVAHLVLYRAWTGHSVDRRAIKPIARSQNRPEDKDQPVAVDPEKGPPPSRL